MLQRCLNALGDCSSRDVLICVEGDCIVEARSEQLRKVSRFFRQALTEDARVDGKYLIAISGISKDVLDTLLSYAETGTLNLYEHEVADVYFAAHKLQMPFVVHKCLQVRPLVKAEALATSRSKAVPKSPKAPSAAVHVSDTTAEVKDGATLESTADQGHAGAEAAAAVADGQPQSEPKSPLAAPPGAHETHPTADTTAEAKGAQAQPVPGAEAQAEGQPKPELRSPPLQPPTEEATTSGIGEARDAARAEVKPDQVQASATQSETEIPRILRVAPRPAQPQGDGTVADEISSRTLGETYRSPGDKAKPSTTKEVQQLKVEPYDTAKSSAGAQKASAVANGSQAKPGTPKGAEQKAGAGSPSVDGWPQAVPGSSKAAPGSSGATPKVTTGSRGTPVQGTITPVQKPVVQEVIGPAASQAQVLSAAPLTGARRKEQSPAEQQHRRLTTPSATARTFLDVVLEHFKQLMPDTIRPLPPTEVIELLKKDDLETCCEIPVFVASLVWLHADYPGRSAYARELMGCVRFSRMTADQLIHCFFPPLRPEVVEIPEVKQLLLAGCCYLCASLQQCRHLFPQYAVQPRIYSGRHRCHLWQLPNPSATEEEVRLQLDILRETYLQRRQCHCSADSHDGLSPEGRFYGIARTLLLRRRYIDLHCYQPDPEDASRGGVVQRSFGKRRYSVQKRLEWTESVWRQVGFSERLRAPQGEPVIALLGGCEPDKMDRVSAGLCMARLYPKKSPFFKRFGILPRPLYHVKAVCFNRTIYVVGGLDLRQAALRVKRPSKCCFALDMSTMTWRRLADMSQGRLLHVLVEHQGRLYALGGLGERNRVLSSAECYDPSADHWTTLSGRLCCPRMASASVTLGPGRLVLGGGTMRPVGDSGNAYLVDDVVALKLPQLTTEHLDGGQRLPKLPSARLSSCMALLANGGLLVVGGATYGPSGFRSLDDVLLLKNPGVDVTWTKLCPMPFRIHSALVVAIGQDVYAIGGCTDHQDGNGARTDMLVMRAGCAGHHHDDSELCWEPWGTLPGRLVGMEAVVFRAEDARPSDPSNS